MWSSRNLEWYISCIFSIIFWTIYAWRIWISMSTLICMCGEYILNKHTPFTHRYDMIYDMIWFLLHIIPQFCDHGALLANLQPHENSIWELTICSETSLLFTILSRDMVSMPRDDNQYQLWTDEDVSQVFVRLNHWWFESMIYMHLELNTLEWMSLISL